MGLGCGGKCGMFFLITINTLFLLMGLAMLIVGIIMRVNGDALHQDEVIKLLNKVSFNGTLSLGNVANSLSILIICLGVFIMLVAALGAFGACCKNRCLLVTYAIIVILIFVVQCVGVGLWFTMKDKVENKVRDELSIQLNNYEGVTSTKEESIGWDLLFIGFDCCGVDAISASVNSNEFSQSVWYTAAGHSASEKVPTSCCTAATEDNYKTYGPDTACTDTLTAHQTKGCYQAFKDWLTKYQNAALAIGIILLIIEIIAIVFAFVVCCAIGDKDMIV